MFNIYKKTAQGPELVHQGANYRQAELYRAQSPEVEVFDVGGDPYEESKSKRIERNMEAEQEAKMIAHRDYCIATCDHFGHF